MRKYPAKNSGMNAKRKMELEKTMMGIIPVQAPMVTLDGGGHV